MEFILSNIDVEFVRDIMINSVPADNSFLIVVSDEGREFLL
jgi:hypothetical protein